MARRLAPPTIARTLDELAAARPAVAVAAGPGDQARVATALAEEEARERAADETYWAPRIRELEALRHAARRRGG